MSYGEKTLLIVGICGLLFGIVVLFLFSFRKVPLVKTVLLGLTAIVILLVIALSLWAILQSTGVVDQVFLEWFKKVVAT
ncbi:hypothetical protein CXP39_00235 [Mesoplasma syrphidae]|uniref:Uncharacterized protein n=1 Tax=Mesoplasma syrphidae TaxID=225999 RepID=A0A2K9BXZ2_9MOLU|nr:hypothetical protein [Mesoplasma syrphidae]AUF83238.1 hypothetical protein CXP39_00235 [Mesoplasma syrphidae]